jgi:PIN like domain
MDERYGVDSSQLISDVQWIEEATDQGDVLLTKDLRIAVNPLEAATVDRVSAHAFGLARRDVDGPTMGRYSRQSASHIPPPAPAATG